LLHSSATTLWANNGSEQAYSITWSASAISAGGMARFRQCDQLTRRAASFNWLAWEICRQSDVLPIDFYPAHRTFGSFDTANLKAAKTALSTLHGPRSSWHRA